MDLGFRRNGRRFRAADRAMLDQQRLVATLSAAQAAGPTARAMLAIGTVRASMACDRTALAELYVAGPRWREAAGALDHVFCRPRQAKPSSNGP